MIHHFKKSSLLFIALFLAAGSGWAAENEEATPAIHIEETTFDFGEVPRGELVKHEFAVVNQGTAPLKIQKIQTD